MTSLEVSRYVAVSVGALQVFANALAFLRGMTRLPHELAKEAATPRVTDLLRTSWTYATLGNVCVSALLLVIAGALREGDGAAWTVAATIGAYYVLVGLATYFLSPERHPGLLVFTGLGTALLLPLLWSRFAAGL